MLYSNCPFSELSQSFFSSLFIQFWDFYYPVGIADNDASEFWNTSKDFESMFCSHGGI